MEKWQTMKVKPPVSMSLYPGEILFFKGLKAIKWKKKIQRFKVAVAYFHAIFVGWGAIFEFCALFSPALPFENI